MIWNILRKTYNLKIGYTDINISLVNSMGTESDELITLSGAKIPID